MRVFAAHPALSASYMFAQFVPTNNTIVSPPILPLPTPVPSRAFSPLCMERFDFHLRTYPDAVFANKFLDGLIHGFPIDYTDRRFLRSTKKSLTAFAHPNVVSAYIKKNISLRHRVGPFPIPPFQNFVCSSLGVRPKKTGGHPLIMDLSKPFGQSVNDFISKADFPLVFCNFDDAVRLVTEAGPGALMGKMDVRYAFRLMPVHPFDWELLGYQHNNQYFFDTVLPFEFISWTEICGRFLLGGRL